jgi:hypothetical protein
MPSKKQIANTLHHSFQLKEADNLEETLILIRRTSTDKEGFLAVTAQLLKSMRCLRAQDRIQEAILKIQLI